MYSTLNVHKTARHNPHSLCGWQKSIRAFILMTASQALAGNIDEVDSPFQFGCSIKSISINGARGTLLVCWTFFFYFIFYEFWTWHFACDQSQTRKVIQLTDGIIKGHLMAQLAFLCVLLPVLFNDELVILKPGNVIMIFILAFYGNSAVVKG